MASSSIHRCIHCSEPLEDNVPRSVWEYNSDGTITQSLDHTWNICKRCGKTNVLSDSKTKEPPYDSHLFVPWYCSTCQVSFLSLDGYCNLCRRTVGEHDDR